VEAALGFLASGSGAGAGGLTGGVGAGRDCVDADGGGGVGRDSGNCDAVAGLSELTCEGALDGFRSHSAAIAIPSAATAIATAIQMTCPPPVGAIDPDEGAIGGVALDAGLEIGAPLCRSLPRSRSAASARAAMLLATRSCGLIAADRPASVNAARKFPEASACSASWAIAGEEER
jgi:hypothetical protein